MDADRQRWNERYREEGLRHGAESAPCLAAWLPEILALCPGRRALDVACGEGRHSIFLARHGFQVTGLDISDAALAKARSWAEREVLTIDFQAVDLEEYQLVDRYDLIVNINFLLRPLLQQGVSALVPGGVLLVDTILAAPSHPIPHNPAYLLQPGELSRIFAPLPGRIIHLEERPSDQPPTARLLFQAPRPTP